MENMEEDARFYKLLAGVEDKNKISKSNSDKRLVNATEFWSQIDMKYINILQESFAYKYDLEMFGYSIHEYFRSIGINLI